MTSVKLSAMSFTRVVSDEVSERAGARAPRHAWHRTRSLPAVGMPVKGSRRRLATAVSIALHLLMIWVLVRTPNMADENPNLVLPPGTGGGAGPAGGGGGGMRGTGGVKYVQIAPPPPAAPPQAKPILPPLDPVVEPPKPVLPEPKMPTLEVPKLSTTDPKTEVKVESPIIGTGGGTGNDGTRGNGPGTGGGIGSGVGTGRGSGVGPGTGGGPGENYMATLIEMPLLPMDTPPKVKGFTLKAVFDVDEKGNVVHLEFTPTKDGDFNKKIREALSKFRFRPAVTPMGTPIRSKYPYEWVF